MNFSLLKVLPLIYNLRHFLAFTTFFTLAFLYRAALLPPNLFTIWLFLSKLWYSLLHLVKHKGYFNKYAKKFSVFVGTAIKSTEANSWDETQSEYTHFNHCFSCTIYLAKLRIKMHALRSCFISAVCFSVFLLQSLLALKIPNFFLFLFMYFL